MAETRNAENNKTDAEMSMAIENLSAIIDEPDMDKVIALLQQNSWDESAAAQAYYAQQAQQEMNQARPAARAGLNHSIQTDGAGFVDDYGQEAEGVRRPIEYQEDQLVGGPDDRMGLLGISPAQMMAMQQRQMQMQQQMMAETPNNAARGSLSGRRREHRLLRGQAPMALPQLTYENLVDTVTAHEQAEAEQPGVMRRFFGGVRAAFSSAFGWCNDRDEEEVQNQDRASAEILERFRGIFVDNYRVIAGNTNPVPLQCFTKTFSRMCVASREQKKPILALVMKEATPQCFREALTALVPAEAAVQMISDKFIFTGFSLAQPPIEDFAHIINLGDHQAAFYFVVVQHDAKVQLMRRLNLSQADTSAQEIFTFLQESQSFFSMIAEEDPGYAQREVLQNAGLIPVSAGDRQRASSQQRPVSAAHADPDAALRERQRREYEEAQLQDQIKQSERREREDRERREAQARQEAEDEKEDEEELARAIEFERRERAATIIAQMPEEPAAGTADVAEVVFRAQGTGKRINRRFMKTDKPQMMYNFVRTLTDEDLGFDDKNSQFQILQTMPRKIFEEDGDQTLEQLGIFPRALLQIQECNDD